MELSSSSCKADSTMLTTEMETTASLAELAQGMPDCSTASGSGNKWWKPTKSKRGRRPIATALSSPPAHHSYSNLGQAVLNHEIQEKSQNFEFIGAAKAEQDISLKKMKLELDVQSHEAKNLCSTSCSFAGRGRSRRSLTEEEKEARRHRRVLANRESARQTIRRRQVLYEELTRKEAELALENENLKKEKDMALKQYQCLEMTNKRLKKHVAEATRTEAEESAALHKPTPTETSVDSSIRCPLLLYSYPPIAPFFCPTIVQCSTPVHCQHVPQGSLVIPSNPGPAGCWSDSCEQNNYRHDDGRQGPLYIMPYPWLVPLPACGNGQPSNSFGVKEEISVGEVKKQCHCPSSNTVIHVGSSNATLPMELRKEAFYETRPVQDPKECSIRLSSDVVEQRAGSHVEETFCSPVSTSCLGMASTVQDRNVISSHLPPNIEAISMSSTNASAVPEKKPRHSKSIHDATAAAEARRRRKELTKLKNLHSRQSRMQC